MGFCVLPDCFQFCTVMIPLFVSLIPPFRGKNANAASLWLRIWYIFLWSLQEMTAKIALNLRGDFVPSLLNKADILLTLVTLHYGLNVFCITRCTGAFWDLKTMKLYRPRISSKDLWVERLVSCSVGSGWKISASEYVKSLEKCTENWEL